VREGATFEPVSREAALVLNNLFLTVILSVVLIGTLYPIVAQAMGQQISIGPPYFNPAAGSVALLLVVAMAAGPLMRWRHDGAGALMRRMALPLALGAVVMGLVRLMAPEISILSWLGLSAAALAAAGSLAPLWGRNLRRTPLFTWGMVVSHLGVAVALAGMATDTAFMKERLVAVREGEAADVGPYSVRLVMVAPVIGPNWTALEATMEAQRGTSRPFTLKPQARNYSNPPTDTSEAAISTRWDGQLYAVLGKQNADGSWQLRLWWKPWVTLIWLGGGLIALGGVLSLLGRLWRERRGLGEATHA
jgi:cytochrome c-type biogenesis protein CcmF